MQRCLFNIVWTESFCINYLHSLLAWRTDFFIVVFTRRWHIFVKFFWHWIAINVFPTTHTGAFLVHVNSSWFFFFGNERKFIETGVGEDGWVDSWGFSKELWGGTSARPDGSGCLATDPISGPISSSPSASCAPRPGSGPSTCSCAAWWGVSPHTSRSSHAWRAHSHWGP